MVLFFRIVGTSKHGQAYKRDFRKNEEVEMNQDDRLLYVQTCWRLYPSKSTSFCLRYEHRSFFHHDERYVDAMLDLPPNKPRGSRLLLKRIVLIKSVDLFKSRIEPLG